MPQLRHGCTDVCDFLLRCAHGHARGPHGSVNPAANSKPQTPTPGGFCRRYVQGHPGFKNPQIRYLKTSNRAWEIRYSETSKISSEIGYRQGGLATRQGTSNVPPGCTLNAQNAALTDMRPYVRSNSSRKATCRLRPRFGLSVCILGENSGCRIRGLGLGSCQNRIFRN